MLRTWQCKFTTVCVGTGLAFPLPHSNSFYNEGKGFQGSPLWQ